MATGISLNKPKSQVIWHKPAIWLLAVAILVTALDYSTNPLLACQDVEAESSETSSASPPPPASEVDLILLANSPGTQTAALLRESLIDVNDMQLPEGEKLFSYQPDNVLVREISSASFDSLSRLVAGDVEQTVVEITDGMIQMDSNRRDTWRVFMLPESPRIKSIQIRFVTPEGVVEEDFPLFPPGSGEPFTIFNANLAILELPKKGQPTEYRVLTEAQANPDFRPWPMAPKHFFVKLSGFQGGIEGRQQLFQILKQGVTGSTFVAMASERMVLMTYAGVDVPGGEGFQPWFERKRLFLFPIFKGVEWNPETKTGVGRVWLLLPRNPEDLAQVEKDLWALNEDATPRKFMEYVRGQDGQGTGKFPLEFAAAESDETEDQEQDLPNGWVAPDLKIGAESPSAWLEIPFDSKSGNFRRSVEFEDLGGWLDNWQSAEPNFILIYETQFPVSGGGFSYRALKNGDFFWRKEAISDWPTDR